MTEQEPASLQITTPKREMYWGQVHVVPGIHFGSMYEAVSISLRDFRCTIQGSTGSGGGLCLGVRASSLLK